MMMPSSSQRPLVVLGTILVLFTTLPFLHSFTIIGTNVENRRFCPSSSSTKNIQQITVVVPPKINSFNLFMNDNNNNDNTEATASSSSSDDNNNSDSVMDGESEETSSETSSTSEEEEVNDVIEITSSVESDDVVVESEEPPVVELTQEEKEMIKLKTDINVLELELKNKRRTLSYYNDMGEEYTKTGYARKVADMETMRRKRSMVQSSNKYSATANTIVDFLPILEALGELKSKYGEDTFGKQYSTFYGAMNASLKALGVTEYSVEVGASINPDDNRVSILESQYSEQYPMKDIVMEVLVPGLELQGNVVRPIQIITSLGSDANVESTNNDGSATDA